MFNIRVTDYITFYDPVKKLLCQSGQRHKPTFPHSNGTICGRIEVRHPSALRTDLATLTWATEHWTIR